MGSKNKNSQTRNEEDHWIIRESEFGINSNCYNIFCYSLLTVIEISLF